jgi:hypothetical protein
MTSGVSTAAPAALLFATLGLLVACSDGTEAPPDDQWEVTVTGIETNCTEATQGYQESFRYMLYNDGSATELRIEGPDGKPESFASGIRSGCRLNYESAVWLEDRAGGLLRWQLKGSAAYQTNVGGCDIEDGYDWVGTETITVVDSEDEAVPVGCTYEMEVTGTYVQP